MIQPILLLGDERLYQKSEPIEHHELSALISVVDDLHDTLMEYRRRYGAGRAIAAPQIGVFRRLIYLNIGAPEVFINPVISFPSDEEMEVLDDCMSFPGLFVKLKRHKHAHIEYYDLNWNRQAIDLQGPLSELVQHEYDHLDGILATMRAIDDKSYSMKPLSETGA